MTQIGKNLAIKACLDVAETSVGMAETRLKLGRRIRWLSYG